MDSIYKIMPVTMATADLAYLVIAAAVTDLTLLEWRTFCHRFSYEADQAEDRETVVLAISPAGYARGLCIYVIRNHASGRILDIPFLIALSATDAQGLEAALLDYMRQVSECEHCDGIRIWRPAPQLWQQRLDRSETDCVDRSAFLPPSTTASYLTEPGCSRPSDVSGRVYP